MHILFKEVQKFSPLIWVLLLPIAGFILFGLFKQLVLGEPFGDNPMPDIGIILVALLILAVVLLFLLTKLKTQITKDSIRISFSPFVNKTIQWQDVKTAEVLNYGFVGYGVRLGTKHGTVYNTSGNKGLALVLKNGTKFVVGTQKEEELKQVVAQLRNF